MNKEIILSIIIPTYNRVSFLKTTVNNFISQIKDGGFENEVEIVIGDDCSPDKTAEYLKQLESAYFFIKTFSNKKNLGVGGNIEKLVRTASAKFLWLFGEDDLITPLALKRVMESLKADKPNLLLLNTANIISFDDQNLKYEIQGENRIAINNDIFIESFEAEKSKLSSIKNWLYLTNLVSAVGFSKDMFLANLSEAKKYVHENSVYLFQAPLIIGLARQGRLKIIAVRSVLHRKNENHWSKNFKSKLIVSLYDGSEIIEVIKKNLPSEYKAYQKLLASHTYAIINKAKLDGENFAKCAFDALKKYYNSYPNNIRFILLLLNPRIILNIFKKS